METPVVEMLVAIFVFGLVISGIVLNGMLRAREISKRVRRVEREERDAEKGGGEGTRRREIVCSGAES